jgi:hypothetical protein
LFAEKIRLICRVTNFTSNPLISRYNFHATRPIPGQKRDFSLFWPVRATGDDYMADPGEFCRERLQPPL